MGKQDKTPLQVPEVTKILRAASVVLVRPLAEAAKERLEKTQKGREEYAPKEGATGDARYVWQRVLEAEREFGSRKKAAR